MILAVGPDDENLAPRQLASAGLVEDRRLQRAPVEV
jgi:hypothetical protein